MNPQANPWLQALGAAGARFNPDNTEILDFGQPGQELQQAATGSILVPLLQLACIEAGGPDAKSFLHSQFTNDVNHLQPGQAQLSSWCNAKGRMQASFINYPLEQSYRLLMAAELVPPILKRLQMFVLRSQVQLTDLSGQLGHLGLAGTAAAPALAAAGLPVPDAPMSTAVQDQVCVIRLADGRFIVAAPQEILPTLWQQLSAHLPAAGLPAWHWLDVQAALPWVTGATREEFVPQMADFEKMGGVSFHKGCYPGQEVVARTQYLGKVKRHLYRLKSPVPLAAGEHLHSPASPDQAAGQVLVCAPDPAGAYVALAVVLAPGAEDLHQGDASGPLLEAVAVNP